MNCWSGGIFIGPHNYGSLSPPDMTSDPHRDGDGDSSFVQRYENARNSNRVVNLLFVPNSNLPNLWVDEAIQPNLWVDTWTSPCSPHNHKREPQHLVASQHVYLILSSSHPPLLRSTPQFSIICSSSTQRSRYSHSRQTVNNHRDTSEIEHPFHFSASFGRSVASHLASLTEVGSSSSSSHRLLCAPSSILFVL